jgi:hypothetical protein
LQIVLVADSSFGLTRRETLRLAALGAASALLAIAPAAALADNAPGAIPIFDGMTVGDVIAISDPEHWESLPREVREALLTAPVEGGPQTRGSSVGGSAWVTPYGGSGSSSYNCGYTTRVSCPGLEVYVTYSNGGVIYYNMAHNGSGQSVYGSGAAYLSPGTYSVVATGYPYSVPSGYDVEYSQSFGTARVS